MSVRQKAIKLWFYGRLLLKLSLCAHLYYSRVLLLFLPLFGRKFCILFIFVFVARKIGKSLLFSCFAFIRTGSLDKYRKVWIV